MRCHLIETHSPFGFWCLRTYSKRFFSCSKAKSDFLLVVGLPSMHSGMAEENLIELKFRIFDGTDIGSNKYDPSTTVAALKEFILARWPQGKEISPRTINDMKLINAGKILENNRTISESRTAVGEIPGGIITMHVVVQPPISDKNNENQQAKSLKHNRCRCTIL